MKIIALVTLAAAVLAFTSASPIARRPHLEGGHSVPLTRNPHFKHNTRAQMVKLNKRYPGVNILAGSSGKVPLTDVSPDLEYYGTVAVGTPAQNIKVDFDTGSSDIWFPSSTCTTTACNKHNRFNSASSSTYQKDGRKWSISYGDGSTASGIKVRQTIGLATAESSQFGSSPADGLFGLGFDTIESVSGVKTFLDNAMAAGALAQPVVSVFLPSERRFNGHGGEYLFGGINSSKYTGSLTYVPVTQEGYWQISIDDAGYSGQSLGQSSQGIVDTGTTLIVLGDDAAQAIHNNIDGATNDPNNGWVVPCSVAQDTENYVSFSMSGADFKVPLADLAYEDLSDGSGNCFSGVQGGQNDLWILGDVFIKNNYCVFSQTSSPSIGIAPLA
ncbi:1,3-beta-glucanosyltransferase [Linnemannia schmuckeri]|uniref:rhizopuspepsin n=1 Tax=Linnemannia schmuckeri TaxID=64567 RepID=A0A9P5RSY8_9FUNG|nr:1,3-beta-glucanosyltransferase [Linnemannia schmuckeri]